MVRQTSGERNNIWYVHYKRSNDGFAAFFPQLYVNGVRAERARSNDFISSSRKDWWQDNETPEVRDGIYVKKQDIKAYRNSGDIRLLWLEEFKALDVPADALLPSDDDEVILKMKQPHFCDGIAHVRYQPGSEFLIINALEELDEPGEWYLDQKNDKVYYYPRKVDGPLHAAEVYAPRVEGLMRVSGAAMMRAKNLRFEGITFQHGNWTDFKDRTAGNSQAEIDKGYTSELPGQIVIEYADNVTIAGCTVRHMGSCGIQVYEGCANTLIEGNLTYDTTGAGITVGSWKWDKKNILPETIPADTMIRNNVVRNTGRDYLQGTGINIFNAYRCKVYHNDISDTSYSALHARVGGADWVHPKIGTFEYKNNKVSRSFQGHKWGIGDGGNVYMHGRIPGSIVEGNYSLYANRNINFEYYSDNYSHTVIWRRNVSRYSQAKSSFHAWHPDNVDVVFEDNYSDNPKQPGGRVKVVSHHIVQNDKWPDEAKAIMNNAGVEPAYRHLLKRIYGHDNLAEGKITASSSSLDAGHKPAAAVDFNWDTFWSAEKSNKGPAWWAVDLGGTHVIQRLTLIPRQDNDDPQARMELQIHASNDPTFKTYDVLAERNNLPWYYKTKTSKGKNQPDRCPASNMWEQYINVDKSYRYLRVISTNPDAQLSFAEFGAYGIKAD